MNQNIINGLFRSCENGDLQHIVDYFEKNPQKDLIVDDNQITLLQVAAANNQVSFMVYYSLKSQNQIFSLGYILLNDGAKIIWKSCIHK